MLGRAAWVLGLGIGIWIWAGTALADDTYPSRPINLIIGAGYQIAVTPNPVVKNNFVATVRITF